jgi:hypothetical protein
MTSTLEKIVTSMSIVVNKLHIVRQTTDAQDEVAIMMNLLHLGQGSLISYIENIRHKRRQQRASSRRNRKEKMSFIQDQLNLQSL